ncbi:NAD+ synthase (glutamine-hydrolyzing) [Dysgonomonas sp. PFB1-18]|uniref:NAD(+) synthase n=1 Tax=unclassified Dysgonomonas TaxID=2630389 RepID=UPI0024747A05|nr:MULTISPECIES: NAD(+) synthase [unclassified Dysgonomonas]MDH6307293.1 NAD+ synthase (glutamine-hydrolyzing) [Dysgonomonas sp. PF1-14]MDH6337211.1 NAD+ synthase (glutamine-hydrolyzing) [Dysgonomonas sp. PF1-16]MDH6379135.1 NAD+ synthase (glutamine-hydrolyzing) [Dysgonomonas sp. PFB1-18]MDH6396227.1 NAD+ synthase (glutamine-hydrolyzing) [Dysgonomonas sp. PF1-23]
MNNYGFVRFAAASPSLRVADCDYNTSEILKIIDEAESRNVSAIVFPELCITGYTCADLFLQRTLLDGAEGSLRQIKDATKGRSIVVVVGAPLQISGRLYNMAVAICGGRILGAVPKTFLPNYSEFYEMRWFSSSGELKETSAIICGEKVPVGINLIFKTPDYNFAIDICEDLWTPIPPSCLTSLNGAEVIFNLSASNETAGKQGYRKVLVSQQSARCIAGYVYAAAGNGESTTDIVFSGSSMIAENGSVLAEGERFTFDSKLTVADIDIERLRNDRLKNKSFSVSEYSFLKDMQIQYVDVEAAVNYSEFKLQRRIPSMPFVPADDNMLNDRCDEIFSIQVGGLAKRLLHTNIQSAVIGVSGGLDSTLALLVLVKAFDKLNLSRKNIYGITMPGFGTTDRTYTNAIKLMQSLGVTIKEISIKDAVIQHFKDIEHDSDVHDITYENSQARERTQILMDYANKVNGLVIGTGDLSELALGWCTYNGDHMSMYAVNTGIPKTLVRTLVAWISRMHMDNISKTVLDDVIETPVSPELLPADKDGNIAQKTEDVVGPYVLHDFFLYYVLRFGFSPVKIYYLAQHAFAEQYQKEEILKWLKVFFRRFFSQQFKRSCMPDGPKVGSVNLSPRGDWRMPSDAAVGLWLKELEAID